MKARLCYMTFLGEMERAMLSITSPCYSIQGMELCALGFGPDEWKERSRGKQDPGCSALGCKMISGILETIKALLTACSDLGMNDSCQGLIN